MILSLKENGLDSLKYGLEYFNYFFKLEDKYSTENPTYLKVSIIMIHNACELILKDYVSRRNELLIYDIRDNKRKNQIMRFYSKNNNETSLEKYVTDAGSDVKTIDYSELIEIYKVISDCDERVFSAIKQIGVYRNKITHYGIDLRNEYYGILESVKVTLDLILEGELSENIRCDLFVELSKQYDDLYLDSEDELIKKWEEQFVENFKLINKCIHESLSSDIIRDYSNQKNIKIKCNESKSIYGMCSEFLVNNKDKWINFFKINAPFINVTFFARDEEWDGPIYFLIDHVKKKLIIFKEPIKYENYEYSYDKFWESQEFKSKRIEKDIEVESFNMVFKKIIDCIFEN